MSASWRSSRKQGCESMQVAQLINLFVIVTSDDEARMMSAYWSQLRLIEVRAVTITEKTSIN